jgi:hypothetical protein
MCMHAVVSDSGTLHNYVQPAGYAASNLPECSWHLQAQVQHMTKKYHIYMTMDGRISMAGLSGSSCKYLAEAMKDAVENVKA